MSRLTIVNRPADYPGEPDAATRDALADLFGTLFPGVADPFFDEAHTGIAIAAQNPALALRLAQLSRFMVLDMPWSQRRDLFEIAVQVVHLHFKCNYSFDARRPYWEKVGLAPALLDALVAGDDAAGWDAEQRLAIDYSRAVLSGDVPADLFAAVAARYGEKGAVEFTSVIGFWSFWAMLINAARPQG